jgi:hypothetical protein
MKTRELQYHMHDGRTAFRFELAGHLSHEGACRPDQNWRSVSSVIGGHTLIVHMTFVTGFDQEGRALIVRWNRDGAQLIDQSKLRASWPNRYLVSPNLGRRSRPGPP